MPFSSRSYETPKSGNNFGVIQLEEQRLREQLHRINEESKLNYLKIEEQKLKDSFKLNINKLKNDIEQQVHLTRRYKLLNEGKAKV